MLQCIVWSLNYCWDDYLRIILIISMISAIIAIIIQ